MKDQTRLDLDPHPSSARAVRRAVAEFCEGREVDAHSVILCASELVANALLHGQPPYSLELWADETRLRVSIFDGGAEQVVPRGELMAVVTSGRGLGIVQTLSSRWAVEHGDTGGKVVWFEIDLEMRAT